MAKMKQFEKWWNYNHLLRTHCPKKIAIEIWKAALEWALKSGYVDDYGDDIINGWDIEEELNGNK